jgi:hypothetical protein
VDEPLMITASAGDGITPVIDRLEEYKDGKKRHG